jgi:quinol monooxygenase YgiN
MIHVIATIRAVAGRRDDLLAAFRELVSLVWAEPGCLEYGPAIDLATGLASQPAARDDVLVVIEKWASVDALKDHLVAPHMLKFREKVKDLVADLQLRVLEPV